MASLDAKAAPKAAPTSDRQPCLAKECFATFEGDPGQHDEVRHCNRAGPDGGHTHRWNGRGWAVDPGRMQHDVTWP